MPLSVSEKGADPSRAKPKGDPEAGNKLSTKDAARRTSFANTIVDAKKAKTKDSLAATLASSNPLTSNFWWYIKHPINRMITCAFVLLMNLYVYLGDPASFSRCANWVVAC